MDIDTNACCDSIMLLHACYHIFVLRSTITLMTAISLWHEVSTDLYLHLAIRFPLLRGGWLLFFLPLSMQVAEFGRFTLHSPIGV